MTQLGNVDRWPYLQALLDVLGMDNDMDPRMPEDWPEHWPDLAGGPDAGTRIAYDALEAAAKALAGDHDFSYLLHSIDSPFWAFAAGEHDEVAALCKRYPDLHEYLEAVFDGCLAKQMWA